MSLLPNDKALVAYGILEVGLRLTDSALFYAISLALEMDQSPKSVVEYYRVTDEGLEMRGYIDDSDTEGFQQLPYTCNARQSTDFAMNWLRTMINDKGDIVDREAFRRFAGDYGGGSDGDYPNNFVLIGDDGNGFTVRPAWMYYPK